MLLLCLWILVLAAMQETALRVGSLVSPRFIEYSPDDFDLTPYQVHQRQLAEQCAELQIPFLDLSPTIAREEARGRHLYWDYDDHPKAVGNSVVAQALFEAWSRLQGRGANPSAER